MHNSNDNDTTDAIYGMFTGYYLLYRYVWYLYVIKYLLNNIF